MKTVFTFKTNPLDKDPRHAQEMCGILPLWVRDYALEGATDLVEYMTNAYGFGKLYQMNGTVKGDQYVSPYEDDEPLDYVAQSEIAEGTVYYFPFGIIALPVEGGHFITRMD